MTNHFVNLVSWRYFVTDNIDSKIHLDSISIRLLAHIYGYKGFSSCSGFVFYSKRKNELKDSLFLTSQYVEGSPMQYKLPYWRDITEVCIPIEIKKELKKASTVVIGISSPKQDRLAHLIQKKYDIDSVYCLGAAIYPTEDLTKYDRYGINWLLLLVRQPKRTMGKIKITLNEVFLILFYKRDRLLFKTFLGRLCH